MIRDNASAILAVLKNTYPKAHIALYYTTPWELLVATQLSAQCTDIRVNIVTKTLFTKYPTLESYIQVNPQIFEQDIKSTGFYRNKAKNILAAARIVKEKFGSQVPRTMSEMLTLPGIARKSANVILGNAYGVVEGIAVDTHMIRLTQRLRLIDLERIGGKNKVYVRPDLIDFKKDADPVKIERELMNCIPKSDWLQTTYQIIDHGRTVCRAQNPNCKACILNTLCPVSRV